MTLDAFSWKTLYDYSELSEYEAKVYTTLVILGSSDARKVSARSGVPRTKVYKVLKGLVDKGFVLKIPNMPAVFAPVSPQKVFGGLIEEYKSRTRFLIDLVKKLEETYRRNLSLIGLERAEVWILKGRKENLRKAEEIISSVENFLTLTTTENGSILFFKLFNKRLDKLIERNVKVTINLAPGRRNHNVVRELQYVCRVRCLSYIPPILFLNGDGRKVLFSYRIPDDYSLDSERDVGLFSESEVFADFLSTIFSFTVLKPRKLKEKGSN
ncbi:hypothetical protein J7L06_07635 [Candidatus Bathyarchaeota archaeon]|nr:hypothetical protein [Candidatus Bathyarchaeota archaeon]